MFNFGKTRAKSLNSFGVAGVLGEKSEVFHTAIFTTRHLGRLSDLLCARLKKSGINEVRFRTLMIFGVYQAYRGQFTKRIASRLFPVADPEVLDTPLLLECGLDGEKLALGLSFSLSRNTTLNPEGLAERITQKAPKDPFEQLIADLDRHADRLILRYQSESRKVEVISLIGIDGKIDRMALEVKPPIEVVVLGASDLENAPRPNKYTAMGDLNYRRMLKDLQARAVKKASATGEFLMPSDVLDSPEEIPLQSDQDMQPATPSKITEFLKRFKSKKKDLQNQQAILVKGAVQEVETVQVVSEEEDLPQEGNELDQPVGSTVAGLVPVEEDSKSDEEESEDDEGEEKNSIGLIGGTKKALQAFFHFLKRGLFGSGRSRGESSEDDYEGDSDDSAENEGAEGSQDLISGPSGDLADVAHLDLGMDVSESEIEAQLTKMSESIDLKALKDENVNAELQAKKMIFDLKTGSFEKLLKQSASDLGPMKKLMKSDKAEAWVRSLLANVAVERSKIAEDARKLYLTVRVKELQANEKVRKLQDHIKSQDAILKAKNNAVMRAREQLNEVTKNVERFKVATGAGDAQLKQKLTSSQRMLQVSHEENGKLMSKVQELNERLSAQQGKLREKDKGVAEAYETLQTRYEKLYKQAEEYRKANRQLIDRVNELKENETPMTNSPVPSDVAMQERVSLAIKAAALSKKELEVQRERVLALQKQEIKLKMKINRLIEELNLKKAA